MQTILTSCSEDSITLPSTSVINRMGINEVICDHLAPQVEHLDQQKDDYSNSSSSPTSSSSSSTSNSPEPMEEVVIPKPSCSPNDPMTLLSTAAASLSVLAVPMCIVAARSQQQRRSGPGRKSKVRNPNQNPTFPPRTLDRTKRNLSIFAHTLEGYILLYAREVRRRTWMTVADALQYSGNPFREALAARLTQGGYYWLKVGFVRNCAIEAGKHKNQDSYQQPKYQVVAIPQGYGPEKRKKNSWTYICTLGTACNHEPCHQENRKRKSEVELRGPLPKRAKIEYIVNPDPIRFKTVVTKELAQDHCTTPLTLPDMSHFGMLSVRVCDVNSTNVLCIKGDYQLQVADLINDVFAATGIVLLNPKTAAGELARESLVITAGAQINAIFLNTWEQKV